MDDFERLGIMYIDDDIEESPELCDLLEEKASDLIAEAQEKFDKYLNSLGLESVMGFIRKKGE